MAEEIRSDLHSTDIPDNVIRNNRIFTHSPKNGGVFTYPSNYYFVTKDEYAEYADIVESVMSEYIYLDRWDVTTRTDGRPNKHYWEIEGVKDE